jgi:hypothetical protein
MPAIHPGDLLCYNPSIGSAAEPSWAAPNFVHASTSRPDSELLASLRESEYFVHTHEQAGAQLRFQRIEAMARSRLRHAQFACGSRQLSRLRDLDRKA